MDLTNGAVGFGMILLSLFLLYLDVVLIKATPNCWIIHGVFVQIIVKDKELFRNDSFKFILILLCCDCTQLLMQIIAGMFTINRRPFHPGLNTAIGAVIIAANALYSGVTVVLAFNRLIHLFSYKLRFALFFGKAMWVWYFLFVLFFAGVTGLLCSPKVKNLYYAKQWYWDWDYDLPWSWAIETIETYWDIGSFAVAGILYFLQIMLMVRMRRQFGAQRWRVRKPEMRLVWQATTITIYMLAFNILCHKFDYTGDERSMRVVYGIINFIWIGSNGVIATVYYVVNRTAWRHLIPGGRRAVAPKNVILVTRLSDASNNERRRATANF
ncbi:SRT-62 protein [Aphelenchoides avenae]|nr:SRT-62 protein [Aphelenchus avenae]